MAADKERATGGVGGVNYSDWLEMSSEKWAQLNDRKRAMREHILGSRQCWCEPRILLLCPECEWQDTDGCWRCDGRGIIPHDGSDKPAIVEHEHQD